MASWSAEQIVSVSLAIQLIEEQFPILAPVHVELCGEGWDNFAFKVNEQFIFRFPRRGIAIELIETEYRLLPKLASRVTLPVPVPQYLGHATAQYPWPFSGYRMLNGRTACSVGFTDEQRCSLAKPLAEFLWATPPWILPSHIASFHLRRMRPLETFMALFLRRLGRRPASEPYITPLISFFTAMKSKTVTF